MTGSLTDWPARESCGGVFVSLLTGITSEPCLFMWLVGVEIMFVPQALKSPLTGVENQSEDKSPQTYTG